MSNFFYSWLQLKKYETDPLYSSISIYNVQVANVKLFLLWFAAELVEQFQVNNLYKTRKSTKNHLSNFGLNEEIMDLACTLLTVVILFIKFYILSLYCYDQNSIWASNWSDRDFLKAILFMRVGKNNALHELIIFMGLSPSQGDIFFS